MPVQPFNEKKPASLSSEILKVLAKVSPERDLRGDALAQAVVKLSRLFTTDTPIIAACVTWMILPTLLPICRIFSQ